MPIIKSSIKDLRRTERRSAKNRAAQGKLRSTLKRARVAVAAGQTEAAQKAVAEALPVIDRAPGKGILHKNAAARHKSRLMRRLAKLSTPAST
ncbi:MAG: rpsT [candidate division NC10 bacterium]|jgi:small subunit ribosomal protein S20|nr:rpsT [candidate division NC10 bacterium]